MKALIPLVLLTTALVGCGSGSDSFTFTPPAVQERANDIVGDWSYTSADTQCLTTIRLDTDGQFRYTSLDEVLTGTYTLVATAQGESKLLLTLMVKTDNSLPDCQGDSDNVAGQQWGLGVEFLSKDQMDFFRIPDKIPDDGVNLFQDDDRIFVFVRNEGNSNTGNDLNGPIIENNMNEGERPNDGTDSASLLEASQRIFGLWQAVDGSQCQKLLAIADDASVAAAENEELLLGSHLITSDGASNLSITISFEQDNGGQDCDGDTDSDLYELTFDVSFPTQDGLRLSILLVDGTRTNLDYIRLNDN